MNDCANFRNYIRQYSALGHDQVEELISDFKLNSFQKEETIHSAGDKCNNYFFLEKGLIKVEYIKGDKAAVVDILHESGFFTDIISVDSGLSSFISFICLSDCMVYSINAEKIRTIYNISFEHEHLGRKIAEQMFVNYAKSVNNQLFYSPEQRYISLIESIPELLQHISQYDIASYLKITPSAFCRLKNRIFKT